LVFNFALLSFEVFNFAVFNFALLSFEVYSFALLSFALYSFALLSFEVPSFTPCSDFASVAVANGALATCAFFAVLRVLINDFFWIDMIYLLVS
jgi:hypothetical protein